MKNTNRAALAVAVSFATLAAAWTASAQEPAQTALSGDVALSMLDIMVKRGLLTQADADAIVAEAKAKAEARAAAAPAEAPLPAGTKRVTYVPDSVKAQIKDEVKQEVMAKAQAEGWAAPGETPEWTRRIKFSGDVRGRYDGTYFPNGNSTGSVDQTNYNAINAGSTPYNLNSGSYPPMNNVDQNRDRMRLRARLGVDADLGEGFSSGIRIATGSGNEPVSTNQSLGGSGGDFSKYQVWLDRAFIKYEPEMPEKWGLTATAGRFANPFFGTDLVWDDDVGFDGVAVSGTYQAAKGVTPFATIGAFPVYNTDFNLSSNQPEKTASRDKWLYGVQAGTDWKAEKDTNVKVGAAYYYFDKIAGKQDDCAYTLTSCASDAYRPGFSQKGNTMMALRNNVGGTGAASDPDYQYYGLASGFRELALTGRVDYDGLTPKGVGPLRVSFDGEFVKNLAFDKGRVAGKAENNFDGSGNYDGGDTGYLARVTVGSPKLAERWDWQASLAYKYVESDAVVDGMTDSDFGMGGTNLKGFILGGDLALSKNVWTSLRWMSADSITGAPFSVDSVFLDITGKF